MPRITSIQIGEIRTEGDPQSRDVENRVWTSAFDKRSVTGLVTVTAFGIHGDSVADTKHHGGPDKAILCYAARHYPLWQHELPQLPIGHGGFGENLTLADADESTVCIGDRYETANCAFEISQPRQPCWKIARRWGLKTLTKYVAQTGRTGWYVRVIQGGELASGETMVRTERPHPEWTVARANDVLFGREADRAVAVQLMNLTVLAESWKADLA